MKNKIHFIAFLLLLFWVEANAQSDTITANIASKYVGKTVVLKGKVVGVKVYNGSQGEMLFINLDKPYPDSEIGVAMFPPAFSKLKIDPNILVDKIVFISGMITIFKDKPNIAIEDIAQFVIK